MSFGVICVETPKTARKSTVKMHAVKIQCPDWMPLLEPEDFVEHDAYHYLYCTEPMGSASREFTDLFLGDFLSFSSGVEQLSAKVLAGRWNHAVANLGYTETIGRCYVE